ncbi:peptide chain release factor N(5)-glutamine methyltransferase [Candidatus Nomurabacteria bacterium]|uniref:Peptide chain release factor N(5)-glutamine methyltransferase n=1 Tax=Candidatus Dojkabacteria bacterium TaxID=2099670 RepID=A0A955KX26_9BACT|nr:peptide chain release factor N(5)-glutamine methyltransferase [Candidatus Dojkabacteria bacterium]MCB9789816.1 peptide chain release factor N(5)-glutamine methyltransferase [Candidatus Nomurabacteria bacterium]MCB9803560.1 peptide chain release factor N(5)-glutamine methyltransferase [Candidatus Nomurabacteria bacterium]
MIDIPPSKKSTSPVNDLHSIIKLLSDIDYPDPIRVGKVIHRYIENYPHLETEVLARLRSDEPYEKIVGSAEFSGLEFAVNKDVLIPRSESEVLVEHALVDLLHLHPKPPHPTICIDVGTGSGNLIITMAKRYIEETSDQHQKFNNDPLLNFLGVDISNEALDVALSNASTIFEGEGIVNFAESDLLEDVSFDPSAQLIIMANLPYVTESEFPDLDPSVRNFDPKISLVGEDTDGLGHYRRLLIHLSELNNDWIVHFEMDPSQVTDLIGWLWLSGIAGISVETYHDQYEKVRFIRLEKQK